MRTFIQLRNGVGYATIVTPANEPDHTVTPDHTTAVEVFTENPEQFLKMQYNAETKTWSEAPVIRYAQINSYGDIVEINYTVFEHEIDHDTKLMNDDTTTLHKWIDGEWVAPIIHVASTIVAEEEQPMIQSPRAEIENEQN